MTITLEAKAKFSLCMLLLLVMIIYDYITFLLQYFLQSQYKFRLQKTNTIHRIYCAHFETTLYIIIM